MTFALAGTNHYQLKSRLDELVNSFVKKHGNLVLEKLDGEEASYEQIIGAVESLPFLAEKKMVIIYDLSANKQAAEALEHIIELAGDTTDLIMVESMPDKRSAYYKQLKKLDGFNEFSEPDENELAKWLVSESVKKNARLNLGDARYLVERVGRNQSRLQQELEKLIQYDPLVNKESIKLLIEENPSSTIFNLIDSVFSGNLDQALHIYDEQRRQKVEPQAIHGMLVWQMHAVAVADSAPPANTPAQISKDSGLSPFVIQKSQRIAHKIGRQKIIEFMRLLRDIDYRGKHEALDYDDALRYAFIILAE